MVVSGFANNLIGSKIARATIQIGVPSNSEKKEHRRCGGDMVFEEYSYLLSIDTFYKYCDVGCRLSIANCCRRRHFLFYLSDYKHSPIVFFLVCGCGCNQSDEKVQPIKKSTIVIKLTVYKQPNCHLSDIQSMCGD